MGETAVFDIGAEVACSDGACGELRRVVLDPVARAITHLVVGPRLRRGDGHLVPIEFVASTGKEIRLTCTKAHFEEFDGADETQLLPAAGSQLGYEQEDLLALPYYRFHPGLIHSSTGSRVSTHQHVPLGEVEVRRGEQVHATDGAIGRVEGLVIDPNNHHVTHFLLQEGHLWGQKSVAIPIGAVTRVGDGVMLNLTKDEVRDLPPGEIDHPE
jgi:sporulation protein YlmC with PRC-barrel domain